MALHKKLTKKGRTDLGTDLNDYDLSFLPTPAPGPFGCEEELIEVFDLEYFDDSWLSFTRQEFQNKIVRKIGLDDYRKIEEGLSQYVLSAKSKSKELRILKLSILKMNKDILNESIENIDQIEIQHLRPNEIEKFDGDEYSDIKDEELIPSKSLKKYIKQATKTTKKYLKKYAAYCQRKHRNEALINSYSDIIISRGFNNSKYYMPNNDDTDILSYYYSTENEGAVFFERSMFSSYSICTRSAEAFMVAFHTRRRAILKGNINTVDHRIMSSFIVSPAFYTNQYEILVLPSPLPLKIYNDPANDIEHNFKLSVNDYPSEIL